MEKIGLKLQEKRQELKLSYKDVSSMTKLPVATVKAIEEGNLDYFKDDLTYVRFYVRSYCKAVNIPYERFKDDISDAVVEYSQTISMKAIKEHENIENHMTNRISRRSMESKADSPESKKPRLAKKDRSSIMQNAQQSSRFRKAKRLDFAFLSLIVVIVIIVSLLIYVGVTSFFDAPKESIKNDDKISDTQTTPKPEDTKKEEKVENEKKPVKTNVVFTQKSVSDFEVSGIKTNEPIKIEVTFKNEGNFNMWKGNTSAEGAYNLFTAGSTYTYQGVVTNNEEFTFNFWNFGGATIKVNDAELTYDATALLPKDGVTYITMTTKGE